MIFSVFSGESWANEFVDSEENVIDWSREYLATHRYQTETECKELSFCVARFTPC